MLVTLRLRMWLMVMKGRRLLATADACEVQTDVAPALVTVLFSSKAYGVADRLTCDLQSPRRVFKTSP